MLKRTKSGLPVKVLHVSDKPISNAHSQVRIVYLNLLDNSIGYARADGTNPNGVTPSDLVDYDLKLAASILNDHPQYHLIFKLWDAGYKEEAVAVLHKDTDLHPADARHFMEYLP